MFVVSSTIERHPVLHHLLDFLKRSPHTGDRKDLRMPAETPTSPAPAPEPAAVPAPPATEEFHRQFTSLADAVRELSRSQQTLLDAITRKAPAPVPQPTHRQQTITGDPGDGLRPAAVVDYTRLSPVQQIALGLRTATHRGARVLPARAPAPQAKGTDDGEPAAGAD
jgi:hypothetical protein